MNGVRLRVEIRPAAAAGQPPLMLVMGLGGHLRMWEPLQRELGHLGLGTIAFDAPGTGDSAGYRWPRRISGIAATIEELLDALGHDQVDVLGVSLGGGLAQQLAHQAPHRVRRLVLAATSTGSISVPGNPLALLPLLGTRRYRDPDFYGRIAPHVFGGRSRHPGSAHEPAARFTRPPSLCGYLAQLYATAGWTSLPWLHTLPQPTLVLCGDDDPIIPVANGRILAALIPTARLDVLPGAGHLFVTEEATLVAALVADFLADRDWNSNGDTRSRRAAAEGWVIKGIMGCGSRTPVA